MVLTDKLITIAQEEEGFLLEFEAEMRAAGQVPDPRPTEVAGTPHHPEILPRPPRPMAERLEHFTEWVEFIPLPSKSSKNSARGLLDGVLSRWGRC